MSLITQFYIKLFHQYVGRDHLGNKYYQSNKTDYLDNKKRYVVYREKIEPSLVPPRWHAWLHHLANEVPQENNQNFTWQQPYVPNFTGTKFAYDPTINSCNIEKKYIKWQPE